VLYFSALYIFLYSRIRSVGSHTVPVSTRAAPRPRMTTLAGWTAGLVPFLIGSIVVLCFTLSCTLVVCSELSRPGGAGHALLFRDNGIIVENFSDLGESEFTFEAWVRTSDSCHNSALFSYAAPPDDPAGGGTELEANHLVLANPNQLVLCHDFEYLDMLPDPRGESCYYAFNHTGPSIVSRDGTWHHVAATWTAANDGLVKIYIDGLLLSSARTRKTNPLQKRGILAIGEEMDCYGACLDKGQGFNGEMDEVRLWRVARSQDDILKYMRSGEGLENHPDLAAYWKMDDPDYALGAGIVKDSSGRGNDLSLSSPPRSSSQRITSRKFSKKIESAGVATFGNNFAMNQNFRGMPVGDISVEFWARTPAIGISQGDTYSDFVSFASFLKNPGTGELVSIDEAILIQKYSRELQGSKELGNRDIRTAGSISISVNSNRRGMAGMYENWIDYNVGWLDGDWHHVAVTWSKETGEVTLFFDGERAHPFWVCKNGDVKVEATPGAGVDGVIAPGTSRSETGSFVLGARQTSFGGNFSPQYSLRGDIAQLRIWDKVISQDDVNQNMFNGQMGPSTAGLVQEYSFGKDSFHPSYIEDQFDDKHSNNLFFATDAPLWVYSTAPLAAADGSPVALPAPGSAGHALRLGDQQVLINRNFKDFPEKAFTIEFWMLSTDTCNAGVPFSYAAGDYDRGDNTVMIGDYNNWVISILEDEGVIGNQFSGVSSADGKWHHIAVTWESDTGETHLYDNGRLVWKISRAQGGKIPSGGSLIIGREQDCVGGCFDSAAGAVGDVSEGNEYGAQDFFGLIDELRVWRRVRTGDEIRGAMKSHLYNKAITGDSDPGHAVNPKDKDLVAYFNFDEGAGYRVTDLTGRGNDLIITQKPVWEVVEYFSVCGNGILEGLEQCDTGDVAAEKGCSKSCTVMDGWECTSTSPSTCWIKGPGDHNPRPPSSDKGATSKDSNGSGIIFIPILALLALCGGGTFMFYRRPELVGEWIERGRDLCGGIRYSLLSGNGRGLDMEHVDLAESPAFTAMQGSPARGGYSRMNA
jgi:cysteine-rich repeat protein